MRNIFSTTREVRLVSSAYKNNIVGPIFNIIDLGNEIESLEEIVYY